MRILALDPSYRGFGVATYDTDTREIRVKKFAVKDKTKITFINCMTYAGDIYGQLCEIVGDPKSYTVIASEYPPPVQGASYALWALDAVLINRLASLGSCQYMILVPPTLLKSLKSPLESMSDTIINRMAQTVLDVLEPFGIKVVQEVPPTTTTKRKSVPKSILNRDTSAALMFLAYTIVNLYPTHEVSKALCEKFSALSTANCVVFKNVQAGVDMSAHNLVEAGD